MQRAVLTLSWLALSRTSLRTFLLGLVIDLFLGSRLALSARLIGTGRGCFFGRDVGDWCRCSRCGG